MPQDFPGLDHPSCRHGSGSLEVHHLLSGSSEAHLRVSKILAYSARLALLLPGLRARGFSASSRLYSCPDRDCHAASLEYLYLEIWKKIQIDGLTSLLLILAKTCLFTTDFSLSKRFVTTGRGDRICFQCNRLATSHSLKDPYQLERMCRTRIVLLGSGMSKSTLYEPPNGLDLLTVPVQWL